MNVKHRSVLTPPERANTVEVEDVGSLQHSQAAHMGGALAQFLQIGVRVLAKPCGVQRGHPEIGHPQPEPVLPRGVLLQVAERHQRDHIPVRGRTRHAEIVGDVSDPQHRPQRRETRKDRQATLKGLRETRLTQTRKRPHRPSSTNNRPTTRHHTSPGDPAHRLGQRLDGAGGTSSSMSLSSSPSSRSTPNAAICASLANTSPGIWSTFDWYSKCSAL